MNNWSMSVGELIKDLERFPKDMRIGYHKPGDDGWWPINTSFFKISKNGESYMLNLVIPDYNGKD